jgi:hypothetical protein
MTGDGRLSSLIPCQIPVYRRSQSAERIAFAEGIFRYALALWAMWLIARLYLNSLRLCLFRFGQHQPEDAIFHGGSDFALIDAVGKGEMAVESSSIILSEQVSFFLRPLILNLAHYLQFVILQVNGYAITGNPRHVCKDGNILL